MARFSSLEQWLKWQESCHPREIDLGLDRIVTVGARLGLLQPRAKVITVAGTNGKGSCVRALQALLLANGTSVGSYTSPHVRRYNERIAVNGTAASDAELIEAFEAIDAARQSVSLTYFEFGTLAAWYLFARAQCAYWLLEVGLGGRLDATNAVDPHVAIITSIGLDHCAWLGDTREAIGLEKAGICRKHTPLVCADPVPPESILQTVENLGCDAYFIGRDFGFRTHDERSEFYWREGAAQAGSVSLRTGLALPSVAAAIQALALLQSPLAMASLRGLSDVNLQGRMQCFQQEGQTWVLDVAHNVAAFEFLWQRLSARFSQRRWTVVIAMMKDKDVVACIEACNPFVDRWLAVPLEGNERALTAAELEQVICNHSPHPVRTAASFAEGLKRAGQWARDNAILVTGSFFTVAEALQVLQPQALDSPTPGKVP